MADTETVPTVAEFALLSAARSGRLKRFYYIKAHIDAVISGVSGGGGKVPPERLTPLIRAGWLTEPPDTSTGFDTTWKITDAGMDARQRWLSQPKGKRKR